MTLAFACMLGCGVAGAADDLSRPPVHPFAVGVGDKIRLWTGGRAGALTAETAVVTAADYTGMMVVVRDQARLVPFDGVTRLEVRRGRSWAYRGALLGLGVGALAGSWLLASDHPSAGDRIRDGLLFGAAGATVGALSGAALHPARWEPVSIDTVRGRPVASTGLSLSLRF
jgi:hypothetical protein